MAKLPNVSRWAPPGENPARLSQDREVCRLAVLGLKRHDIAGRTGLSKEWVGRVLTSDWGLDEQERLNEMRDEAVATGKALFERYDVMAEKGATILEKIITNPEQYKENTVLKAVEHVADRAPSSPKKTTVSVRQGGSAEENLARIAELGARMARGELEAPALDAEFEVIERSIELPGGPVAEVEL